jgi:hypothetical protein
MMTETPQWVKKLKMQTVPVNDREQFQGAQFNTTVKNDDDSLGLDRLVDSRTLVSTWEIDASSWPHHAKGESRQGNTLAV